MRHLVLSFIVALVALPAQTQSSAPGLSGIAAIQLAVEPVDDEARQCGLSDDGLDAAVRIPVSNTQLRVVAESPSLL